ncbi:MAG TPA: YihY/virulence factor BrkB family protein [Candidatus Udaeobacter sp.]|jgi:membrane protein|nr:YihY/virulence factor BrkB family protein [Candidatus Udaeobacter sp.]
MARHRNIVVRTWKKFGADHGSALAAAIAYYVLFSIIPLVTFMVAIFGFIMRDPARQQDAMNRILQTIPLGQNFVLDSIKSAANQTGTLTVIGIVGLIWAASGMFSAIREALNIAWEVEKPRGFIMSKVWDLGAVLGLGILFILSLGGTMMVHLIQTLGLGQNGSAVSQSLGSALAVIGLAVPAIFSFFAFLFLYRFVPNVKHTIGDVWPGALIAALLFELSKHAFAFYVAHFNNYQAIYGALGGMMLFMLWCWVAAYIMLLGAEWAAEHERVRHGPPREHEFAPPPGWTTNA